MVVYCRIQGLMSEKGMMLNGRVGEILDAGDDNDDFSNRNGAERVAVKIDGELNAKLLKWEKLKILSDSDQVKHYTVSWAFNQAEPDSFKFALYEKGNVLVAGGGITPNGAYASSVHMLLFTLKMLLSQFHFNTPTVLHVPVLNVAIALNKLLAGDAKLVTDLGSNRDIYTTQSAPFFEHAVELLQQNPHETFVKWTPGQDLHPQLEGDLHACEGKIEADGSVQLSETANREWDRLMPAIYSYFQTLPGAGRNNEYVTLDCTFKGIYHIYPHRSIENCFDVIYAADDKGSLYMGTFMNTGEASIIEGYIFTKVLQGSMAVTASHMVGVDPSMFWSILLHYEAFLEREENGFMVLPFFEDVPVKNRELLKKRTTAKDDEQGLLLPPAHTTFSSKQDREETSDRHARLGALLCMIELKKRFCHQEITLQVAEHLAGTKVARDMKAALALINLGQYGEATRVLNGGRVCGYCGMGESEAPDVQFSTCSGCQMVDYCSTECLMNDHRFKHHELCGALAADREGRPPSGEMNYLNHASIRRFHQAHS